MMKKLFKLILAVVIIIGLVILIIWNLPKDSSKGKSADYEIDALSLYQAFESDEEKSNQLYIGKILEVDGIISTIETDEQDATVIILQSSDPIAGIMCTLEPEEKDKLSENSIGEKIKIKGVCAGKLMDVVLNKCIIQD